jgi:hypothetical protein
MLSQSAALMPASPLHEHACVQNAVRRLLPNNMSLGSLLRQQVRTNTRMDTEELELATKKVRSCVIALFRSIV